MKAELRCISVGQVSAHSHTNLSDVWQVIKKETSPVLHAPQAYVLPCHKCAQLVTFVCKWAETWPTALPSECLDLRFSACLPFTRANRSVYRLGRFGQMVSKFPHWDWRLPFAEIPTIYQKLCTTATANEKVAKQKLWLTKQRLCTCVIFGIFLYRSVHNYNVKWPNSTVNFRFYFNSIKI